MKLEILLKKALGLEGSRRGKDNTRGEVRKIHRGLDKDLHNCVQGKFGQALGLHSSHAPEVLDFP